MAALPRWNGVAGGYGVVLTSGSITNQATITGGSGGGSSAYYSYDHYIGGNGGGGAKVSGGSLTNATLASIIGGVGGVGSTADGGFGGNRYRGQRRQHYQSGGQNIGVMPETAPT